MKDMEKDINDWMQGAKLNQALPEGKGVVAAIHPPKEVETRHGKTKRSQIVINGSDGSTIHVNLFLPKGFPFISSKSTLGKILAYYDCNEIVELIGKTVEVEQDGDFWNIKGGK